MTICYCTRVWNECSSALARCKRRNIKRLNAEGEINTTIIRYSVEKCDYSLVSVLFSRFADLINLTHNNKGKSDALSEATAPDLLKV